jgi:hypothetical protein
LQGVVLCTCGGERESLKNVERSERDAVVLRLVIITRDLFIYVCIKRRLILFLHG